MAPPRPHLLRTTVVQAFARTVVDDGHRTMTSAPPVVSSRGGASSVATVRHPGAGSGRDEPATAPGSVDFSEETPPPPSTAGLPGVGDVVGGHYRLVRLLGEGMFGKVYVAQRLDVPEHQVALKLLPRALYVGRNVERELVMLATVGHPHVVQLKDHGTTPDYVWLTMPVYEGETLAERLERGTLSLRKAYDIFLPVARGLEALHAAGLRHQDVKPENIFLAVFGGHVHPVLLDLGVAAEKDATFVAGTALYGAPEQVTALAGFVSLSPLSEKMDSYGFAATLLYALVGPKHFPGEGANNRRELLAAQMRRTEQPIGPGAVPELTGDAREQVSGAFRRWLASDPNERPTMRQLCEQLDVLLEQEREEERLEDLRLARQRSTVLVQRIVVAAMLLLGVAGGAVVWSKRETLRVASELAAVREQGKQQFTQLDTCSASYEVARAKADACEARATSDRAEYDKTLESLSQSGSAADAERAREVQRMNGRVKACEDAADKARKSYDDELALKDATTARLKAQLTQERDDARAEAAAEKSEAFGMQVERDACRTDKATCIEERDACRAEKAKAPGVVPARVSPASSAPAPSVEPAASRAPVDPKPPAEPKQAPPPAPPAPPAEPKP